MSPSALKVSPSAGNKIINQGYSSSYGEMSPGGNVDGGIVKVEECSPYSAHNNSPYSSHSELRCLHRLAYKFMVNRLLLFLGYSGGHYKKYFYW